jgi:hypothetical protein
MTRQVSPDRSYRSIVAHYESCLERHGDTFRGVDWPNEEDAMTRYRIMLEVVRSEPGQKVSLLDFGCGASHLFQFMRDREINDIQYSGLDLSEPFITLSKRKYPHNTYYCLDFLKESDALPNFDYVIMNGVFTEKCSLSFDDMLAYFKALISKVFAITNRGIAFNVMSKQVDWERDDLFHLPLDTLAWFLTKEVTRNFAIRNDYGLYEYTTYIYK